MLLGLAACGGGRDEPGARVPCADEDPGEGATYANADVAIGTQLAADRFEGELPWFAKTALFVRSGDAGGPVSFDESCPRWLMRN